MMSTLAIVGRRTVAVYGPFNQALLLVLTGMTFWTSSSSAAGFTVKEVFQAKKLSFPPRRRRPVCLSNLELPPAQRFKMALAPTISGSQSGTDVLEQSAALGAWIPVGSVAALRDVTPTQVEIMGEKYVVWHDRSNRWSVMADACPHRLAPLSQGRLDPSSGCIECPYHGWQFDTGGNVKSIPQWDSSQSLEEVARSNSKMHATSLPVHVAGDLIFAFLPSLMHGEQFPQSLLPEQIYSTLQDQIDRNATFFVRELPYSADFVIENFMDPAHIPFAHNALQGVREDGTGIPMSLLTNNFTHVEVAYKDVIRGKSRDGVLSFQRPTFYHFRTRNEKGDFKRRLQIHIVPIREGWSRVMFESPAPKFIPTWLSHGGSNRFLNTDTWLHDAEIRARAKPDKDLNDIYVMGSSSDFGVKMFRKWWSKFGFANAPPHTFGPASLRNLPSKSLSRREQIDPWMHHSRQCSSCRTALQRWKQVEKAGLLLSVASAVVFRNRPVSALLAAFLFLQLHFMSKKILSFIEGNPDPSGVADRSVAHQK